ncbi:MAG: hypothetical protein NVV60_00670 [Luteimonas sp.]|nr:hypothetical protein [Luteimonas sp.]
MALPVFHAPDSRPLDHATTCNPAFRRFGEAVGTTRGKRNVEDLSRWRAFPRRRRQGRTQRTTACVRTRLRQTRHGRDTPLYDENGDGKHDDGDLWHSHWVVLQPNAACGPGALAVVDIPEGSKPRLPKKWPGFPILLDSPGWSPTLNAETVEVKVPFDDIGVVTAGTFDGVTAGLRVNASVHAPLLCVVDVYKIASGDLSLPGKQNE